MTLGQDVSSPGTDHNSDPSHQNATLVPIAMDCSSRLFRVMRADSVIRAVRQNPCRRRPASPTRWMIRDEPSILTRTNGALGCNRARAALCGGSREKRGGSDATRLSDPRHARECRSPSHETDCWRPVKSSEDANAAGPPNAKAAGNTRRFKWQERDRAEGRGSSRSRGVDGAARRRPVDGEPGL
jgi:hypothetical protein